MIAREDTIRKCLENAYWQEDKKVIEKLETVLANVRRKKELNKEFFCSKEELTQREKSFENFMEGLI